MEQPEDILFRTTSDFSLASIEATYGEALPADILFILAENKNFDAAKAEFDTWDDMAVFDMQYFLGVAFPHKEWLQGPVESFIARGFAMKLINDRNHWPREFPGEPLSADVLTLRRLAGFLPHIDIDGTDFTIDWRLRELRETAKPWNRLDIRKMEMAPDGESYLAFYDLNDHRLHAVDGKDPGIPQHVAIIKIPNEISLDPVAVGWEYGLKDLSLLAANPIKEKITAQVIPVDASLVARETENNLTSDNEAAKQRKGRR